jgi:uncharacterized membrane protein
MTIVRINDLGQHSVSWPGPSFGTYGWPWPGLIWLAFVLLFWGGLIVVLVWAVRASGTPRRHPDTAMEVLRRRFAGGEITEAEFEHMRGVLLRDRTKKGPD